MVCENEENKKEVTRYCKTYFTYDFIYLLLLLILFICLFIFAFHRGFNNSERKTAIRKIVDAICERILIRAV